MQTETLKKNIPVFTDFPPALPPPTERHTEPPQKSRRQTAGMLLRAVCLLAALSTLSLCTVQKLGEIADVGVANYIGNELMGIGADTFGENVTAIAFGAAETTAKDESEDTAPLLLGINYIPLEDITNKILEEEKLREALIDELYSIDISGIPSGAYPIIPVNSGTDSVTKLKNDTSYTIDMNEIAEKAESIAPAAITNEPLVLIVHTHGTESFAEEGVDYYNDEINYPRSEDVSKNIVAVGKVVCDTLNENGIPTIQCEVMHDKESYINAYDRTAQSIQYYLEKYPSIQYIFDVHRDSLIRSDLTKLKPVTLYKNTPCAQVMMIVGSNEKGAAEYDWQSNLVLAEAVQQKLFKDASGIARQLNLRGATYNQQYAKHGLLVEIGSCGNTLTEAKVAAKAFGEAVAAVILGE
ncbi:MAG: stage II sporulation protein P [Clostridia bacterium]|nr:stage II sporulation protein P [Clostridia bacterium]